MQTNSPYEVMKRVCEDMTFLCGMTFTLEDLDGAIENRVGVTKKTQTRVLQRAVKPTPHPVKTVNEQILNRTYGPTTKSFFEKNNLNELHFDKFKAWGLKNGKIGARGTLSPLVVSEFAELVKSGKVKIK